MTIHHSKFENWTSEIRYRVVPSVRHRRLHFVTTMDSLMLRYRFK